MKVLQIINSHADAVGGAEKLATQIHRGCLKHGVDSHLLCLMKAPARASENTYSLHFNTPYHPAALGRLVRFLRQPRWRDVQVIHVHLFPAQLLVALAARLAGLKAPLITTEHNTFNRRRALPGARFVDRFYYRFYSCIVCISEGTRQTMQKWLPELQPKLVTVLNGIEFAHFSNASSQEMGNRFIILSAGRLTEQKNYSLALRVIKELENQHIEYWIAGQGELGGALHAEARALGVEDKVKFLGFRRDLPDLLAQADVFLSTSKWEGFGLSVVEAMAAGLPVVVSDVPGVTEVVERDSGCGFLAAPDSVSEFACYLDSLRRDATLRKRVGDKARKRAQAFDVHLMIENYLRLYREHAWRS